MAAVVDWRAVLAHYAAAERLGAEALALLAGDGPGEGEGAADRLQALLQEREACIAAAGALLGARAAPGARPAPPEAVAALRCLGEQTQALIARAEAALAALGARVQEAAAARSRVREFRSLSPGDRVYGSMDRRG